MVGYTALREVVCTNLCRAVAGRDESLAAVCDVVDILLVLLIIYICTQTCKSSFLVLRLVAGLGTLDEDFLNLSGVRVLPHVAGTHARLHLVHVLSAST